MLALKTVEKMTTASVTQMNNKPLCLRCSYSVMAAAVHAHV